MNIINPATGTLIGTLNEHDLDDVQNALATLRVGQKEWAKHTVAFRLAVISKFGELMLKHQDELAAILTSETGKPIQQSYNEIRGAMNRIVHLEQNAETWLASELITVGATEESISFEPLGVIANISAWNFPYNVGFNVFLYALVGGNAVAYKPSEYASLTGKKFESLLLDAGVPLDVFRCITGGGETGKAMLQADFDGYFFTGSYATGKAIAEAVAHKLVPVQLELGGKDPLFVADDVLDVKQAAINAAEGAFYNNGQSCCAVERIYVHSAIHDAFVEAFVEEVGSYVIGDPVHNDTFIGPLTRSQQLDVLDAQVEDAVSRGASIVFGGKRIQRPGNYFEPTVLTKVNHFMKVMKEESFGPIIGIMSVESDEQAVQLMNDTSYGLTAAVFSSDENRARNILEQMNTGTVYWNCCDRVSPNIPWSGRKNSGLGSTLSYIGIRAFVQPKAWHWRK
jgi:acyl-CoA reductase-like NAD-dependent aldehyde dehydrogenase